MKNLYLKMEIIMAAKMFWFIDE